MRSKQEKTRKRGQRESVRFFADRSAGNSHFHIFQSRIFTPGQMLSRSSRPPPHIVRERITKVKRDGQWRGKWGPEMGSRFLARDGVRHSTQVEILRRGSTSPRARIFCGSHRYSKEMEITPPLTAFPAFHLFILKLNSQWEQPMSALWKIGFALTAHSLLLSTYFLNSFIKATRTLNIYIIVVHYLCNFKRSNQKHH
jgi:hypothetical protein